MRHILTLVTLMVMSFLMSANAQDNNPKARLNHTAIFVTDLKASAHFYKDILGLDTIPEPFHDGKHLWLRTGPAMSLHIIEGSKEKKEYYKNQHTCYSVTSVDDFVTVLKKNNIEFEDLQGKKNVFSKRVDGVKQLWMKDPDGYWVEINDARD
jgi:lactoylglutathione lyase